MKYLSKFKIPLLRNKKDVKTFINNHKNCLKKSMTGYVLLKNAGFKCSIDIFIKKQDGKYKFHADLRY